MISSAVFLAVQILLLFGLYSKGYLDYMRSLAVATYMWVLYSYLEIKYHVYMDNYVRMAVMVAVISDGFFGYYLNYYADSFIFDKVQHVFGSYAFALFAYILVMQLSPGSDRNRTFRFILITCLGISIGMLYEIVEFLVDMFAKPIISSQPSLLDTDLDMICDVIGSALAAAQAVFTRFPQVEDS